MWVAELETAHFSFRAFGETEGKAIAALRAGWRAHQRDYPLADAIPTYADEIHTYEIRPDVCLRDGTQVYPRARR